MEVPTLVEWSCNTFFTTRRLGLQCHIGNQEIKVSQKLKVLLFVGLHNMLLQGYLALFLIFLLKIRPWTFAVFACSSRSHDNQQEPRDGHLSLGLMPCMLHSGQLRVSENNTNLLIWANYCENATASGKWNLGRKAALLQLQQIWTSIQSEPARIIDWWGRKSEINTKVFVKSIRFPLVQKDFFVSEQTAQTDNSHFIFVLFFLFDSFKIACNHVKKNRSSRIEIIHDGCSAQFTMKSFQVISPDWFATNSAIALRFLLFFSCCSVLSE